MPVKIAHGLFSWQDGRTALEACLRSTAPHVDCLLVADGLIQGVDPQGLPAFSDFSWLDGAAWLPPNRVACKEWRSLSAACTWLLHAAKAEACDWLLYVDADQELHNGQALRPYLERWPQPFFPISRVDPVPGWHPVPWQCVHVLSLSRYLAGCFVVELAGGRALPLNLVPAGNPGSVLPASAPWISHHPERRPPGRQSHRLGELETILEPPPFDLPPLQLGRDLLEPLPVADAPTADNYFCDQCGARYGGPGTCTNGHPPAEVRPVKDAADATTSPSGSPFTVPPLDASPSIDEAMPPPPSSPSEAAAAASPVEPPAGAVSFTPADEAPSEASATFTPAATFTPTPDVPIVPDVPDAQKTGRIRSAVDAVEHALAKLRDELPGI